MTSAEGPPAAPERDLALLLRGLRPKLRDGEWVFVTAGRPPDGVEPLASFTEDEGLSLVVRREQADAAGLQYDLVLAWIALTVHSALDAVGLTAAVAGQLAAAGISCNVMPRGTTTICWCRTSGHTRPSSCSSSSARDG